MPSFKRVTNQKEFDDLIERIKKGNREHIERVQRNNLKSAKVVKPRKSLVIRLSDISNESNTLKREEE